MKFLNQQQQQQHFFAPMIETSFAALNPTEKATSLARFISSSHAANEAMGSQEQ